MENGLPAKADVAVVNTSALTECQEAVLNSRAMRKFIEYCQLSKYHVDNVWWVYESKRYRQLSIKSRVYGMLER